MIVPECKSWFTKEPIPIIIVYTCYIDIGIDNLVN